MAAETSRPLRRDAARNRGLILDAAQEAFAEHGLGVTLDEIADRAGVGIGTVYRRFADKDALIDALGEHWIDLLISQAEQALAGDDAWVSFVEWFEEFVDLQAGNRGLKELLLASDRGREHVATGRDRFLPLVTQLVERARATGELRDDVRASDLMLLVRMITSIADVSPALERDLNRRYVGIVLDALRARREGPTALPVPALEEAEFAALRKAAGRGGR